MDDVPPAGVEAAFTLITYYADMLAQRRARPTDDLTSALLAAEVDGDRLTEDEIMGFLFLMVVAGNETTTKLLGNAWYWAWRNPDQRAKPFADPARIADWVEETLRYDTSTQMLARLTTTDVELHGTVIPAGERVVLVVGSANRDERVFPDPDRYDLDRADLQQHLVSFGFGRHFCLGASLARLEARVCLDELVARVADYDIDAASARRVHSVNVRGFASLPTTVTLR
jgi:cytochrome P450